MGTIVTTSLDEHARALADRVLSGDISGDEAAAALLAEAVGSGVAQRVVREIHWRAMRDARDDEFVGGAIHLLTTYVLARPERPSPLDVTRFARDESAEGWLRSILRRIRSTRIEREIARRDDRDLLWEHESAYEHDPVIGPVAPDVQDLREAQHGMERGRESILMLHASVLHRLFEGPALRWWKLSLTERRALKRALDEDPGLAMRSLRPSSDEEGEIPDLVRLIWSSWCASGIADVISKSTDERDVVGLLTRAAVSPLPRPGDRTGAMRSLRSQVLATFPEVERSLAVSAFDAFCAAFVAETSEKDRTSRPLDEVERVRTESLAQTFPSLLREVARASGVRSLDYLSGLTALFLDTVPAVSSEAFTPTPWRF